MIRVIKHPVMYKDGKILTEGFEQRRNCGTIAESILRAHDVSAVRSDDLKIRFDALASHDITYVGIIQTSRASGLTSFPVPYVLTNCHNSLCAVGGTINEDDHEFGLSAAVKYGGIFVPPHQAVIHQYMREMMSGCGRMIIGSDSHTRYGALGTMAVGEGGPELVKQLLRRPYEIKMPEIINIYLTGRPKPGVGPQDVALALIGAVFESGFVKNKILEFTGPGIANLSVDFRNGIDTMTTETTCLSSIWETDEKVEKYYQIHGRPECYRKLSPEEGAIYDGCVKIDLSDVENMIAMPFHPSNVYTVKDFIKDPLDILDETEKRGIEQYGNKVKSFKLKEKFHDGKVWANQGIIAGCAGGTFENICRAGELLKGRSVGSGSFSLNIYPQSQPVFLELVSNGTIESLTEAGASIRSAFCGPCFGAGDVPCNNGFSIRHTTRNFPNREGSKPSDGQISWVALMDARSIAATALNKGAITPGTEVFEEEKDGEYKFRKGVYENRVYNGFGKAQPEKELKMGPNITDWPKMIPLTDNVLLEVVTVIKDPVTTTDELIPSGETSSYRSNPLRLAEYALSRKDPEYVSKAKKVYEAEISRRKYVSGESLFNAVFEQYFEGFDKAAELPENTQIGSVVYAIRPGDGSAREQAASCQRVLGGLGNIAVNYATKRYRSNLINWGMLPFTTSENIEFKEGDRILIRGIRSSLKQMKEEYEGELLSKDGKIRIIGLYLKDLSESERDVLLSGCLINYYNRDMK